MTLQRLRRILPLALLALVLVAFAVGLTRDPSAIPTVLIDAPAPAFDLPPIEGQEVGVATADFTGQVSIVNIFASWCVPCLYEHPTLMAIAAEGGPPIYGVAWRDADGVAAWLGRHGNPYTAVGDDAEGRVSVDFGVTGAPESFIIDKRGRIRYKHVGVIRPEDWRRTLQPIVAQLEAE